MIKQTPGWTRPKLRTPEAADRWTWLVVAAHTQLRLARPLAADLRRPWEKPPSPAGALPPGSAGGSGTPARTRLARPRPTTRLKERHPATLCDVGKTVRRPKTITERDQVRP